MTGGWSAALCLTLAAFAVGWPRRRPGVRHRLLLRSGPSRPGFDLRAARARLRGVLLRRPGRGLALSGLLAALAGFLVSGPVAAVVAATYAALAARALLHRRRAGEERERRRRQLDDLCALAADLRAGLPVTGHLAEPDHAEPGGIGWDRTGSDGTGSGRAEPDHAEPDRRGWDRRRTGRSGTPSADRLAGLTRAAVRLAERTGAPLAELVERIEADARASDRGMAAAAAQAAGARATAGLLAVLPVGGIALGYTIGADPLHVLLHTPLGAACALGALLLQVGGLAWTQRLAAARAWAG